MRSLGNILDEKKGIGPGFDFLRVALAVCIVGTHSFNVTGSPWSHDIFHTRIVWIPSYAILTMFFGLSGFLIAGSALRLNLSNFLINRGLRIVPALLVEIIFSAFILGPILTNLSTNEYFTRSETYQYFGNVIGIIHYTLPGLFKNNPVDLVNGSLWTVPYEYGCYISMSLIMIFGLLKRPWWIATSALTIILIGYILIEFAYPSTEHGVFGKFVWKFFMGNESRLIVAFLFGIVCYLWRYSIPYDLKWLIAALSICGIPALIGPREWENFPLFNFVVAPALIYITSYLGVSPLPKLPFVDRGDYSYGIYLYGMPIQQLCVTVFPFLKSSLLQLIVSLPLITLFAAFSWHVIERPILKLRKRFSLMANVREIEK